MPIFAPSPSGSVRSALFELRHESAPEVTMTSFSTSSFRPRLNSSPKYSTSAWRSRIRPLGML